jgi:hypothetical protein
MAHRPLCGGIGAKRSADGDYVRRGHNNDATRICFSIQGAGFGTGFGANFDAGLAAAARAPNGGFASQMTGTNARKMTPIKLNTSLTPRVDDWLEMT